MLSFLKFSLGVGALAAFPANLYGNEAEDPSWLLHLVNASQAACYDYQRESDTCESVSYFIQDEQGLVAQFDVGIIWDRDIEFASKVFGGQVATELSAGMNIKLVFVGKSRIEGSSICYTLGDIDYVSVYSSTNLKPWIVPEDRPIADATARIKMLLGSPSADFGISPMDILCDSLSEQPLPGEVIEYSYVELTNGSMQTDQGGAEKTIRFYFSDDIPELRSP